VFSNESRSGYCLCSLRARWHLMGSTGSEVAWLQPQSADQIDCLRQNRRHHPLPLPRAVLRSGARLGLLSPAELILRSPELCDVPEHGVPNGGEPGRASCRSSSAKACAARDTPKCPRQKARTPSRSLNRRHPIRDLQRSIRVAQKWRLWPREQTVRRMDGYYRFPAASCQPQIPNSLITP
jgi:hypothetical protein